MRELEQSFKIDFPIGDVWNVLTDLEDFSWRSDLESVELIGEKSFVEVHKSGNKTEFNTLSSEENSSWKLEIVHEQFTGSRNYSLLDLDNTKTEITIYDSLEMKDTITELFSFLSMNLKMQQKLFVRDLKKKLGE